MASLYEIDKEIIGLHNALEKWAVEHDGDITDFPFSDYEEHLKYEKEQKLLSIACWIKNLNSDAAAIKAEEDSLRKRRQAIENKAESLEKLIKLHYSKDEDKLQNSRAVLSYRRSEKVVIDNDEKLPIKYYRVKQEPILSDIKKDIDKRGANMNITAVEAVLIINAVGFGLVIITAIHYFLGWF